MAVLTSTVRIARRRVPVWLVVAAAGVLLLGVVMAATSGGGSSAPPAAAGRPNVVVVMTDDQTLSSLRVMPRIDAMLAAEGVSFTDSIITLPVCCPARATFLTGQYSHNHGVVSNLPPHGGNDKLDHTDTLAVWLDAAGYETSHVGKYLNGYGQFSPAVQPPGWDRWFTSIDPSTYQFWDYTVLSGGERLTFGETDEDYQTDVMGAKVVEEIHALADGPDPFFVVWSTLAPHNATGRDQTLDLSTIPAPRHDGMFAAEPLPATPSFNEADKSDKPAYIRANGGADERFATEFYRRYLESLVSVDEWMEQIVVALDEEGVLDDTIVIFTSDNGMMVGEHGIGPGYKLLPYEESLLVPMVVRGPGFPAGVTSDLPITNLELAATIVRATGAQPTRTLDGWALQDVLADPSVLDGRAALIDNGVGGGRLVPVWEGVRTSQFTYVEYPETLEVELYDRAVDPFQLTSVHADPAYGAIRAQLDGLLDQLRGCVGDACRAPTFIAP